MYDYRKYQQSVQPFFKLLPLETDLQHACLGLISEAGEISDALKAHMIYGKELDVVNLKEEAGDGLAFSQLMAELLKLDFQQLCDGVGAPVGNKDRLISYAIRAVDAAAAISMRVDAFIWERQPLPLATLASELRRFMGELARIGSAVGFTLSEAADANFAKLNTRYKGEVFSAENGLNRDLEAERAVLAAGVVIPVVGPDGFYDGDPRTPAMVAALKSAPTTPATVKTLKVPVSKRP